MITTQIQLGNNGFVDLYNDAPLSLTYSIAEIRDIGTNTGTYSKTIDVPGTAHNKALFGQLFNINVNFVTASFDINAKTECSIVHNGLNIFDGWLQLMSVNKVGGSVGDDEISFTISIVDKAIDLYTAMGEFELTDLTYPFGNTTEPYTLQSILNTSGNTAYNSLHKYHLFYNAKTEYNLTDFRPGIWAKTYWDNIFADAGYTYTWPEMTDMGFDKLIIPFNASLPLPSQTELDNATLRAGWTALGQDPIEFNKFGTNNFYKVVWNDDGPISLVPPLNDPGNVYDINTGIYTSNIDGTITYRCAYSFELSWVMNGPSPLILVGNTVTDPTDPNISIEEDSSLNIRLNHFIGDGQAITTYAINNSEIYNFNVTQTVPVSNPSRYFIDSGNTSSNVIVSGNSVEISMSKNVITGDQILSWIRNAVELNGVWRRVVGYGMFQNNSIVSIQDADYPQLQLRIGFNGTDYSNNYLIVEPTAILGSGQIINLENFIPKQIKQKDFVSSVNKMFNLYMEQNPNKDKDILIKSRDYYYDNGPLLDWSSKLDLSSGQEVIFLPDVQTKKVLFTHKMDEDLYNKAYKENTGEIFGQFLHTYDNEWVDGEKKIETIFAPACIVNDYADNAVTAYPSNTIRILYDAGWIPGKWRYRISQYHQKIWTEFGEAPIATHFDNPYTPSIDYNFGLAQYEGYDNWKYLTNNNLYNKYYRRFISQIEAGRLMKAKFNLKPSDMINLNLASKIWVNESWWLINKITYDANSDGLSTVELISAEDGIKFSPQQKTVIKTRLRNEWVKDRVSQINKENGVGNVYGKNVTNVSGLGDANQFNDFTTDTRIQGQNNQISGTKQFISGDDNMVQGNYNMIIGTGNTVTGDDIMIFGLDGITADQPGLHYVKSLINYANFISAGRDEVLSPYPSTKVVNYIDAGRDVVRALGSYSIETNINGAKNRVI
jgi:hypothetical protein